MLGGWEGRTLRHALQPAQVRLAQGVEMDERGGASRPGQLRKGACARDGAAEAAACGDSRQTRHGMQTSGRACMLQASIL